MRKENERTEQFLTLRIERWKREDGKPGTTIYRGKARYPIVNGYFSNDKSREEYIAEEKDKVKFWEEEKQRRKEERLNFRHSLKVGDIFYSSWGYDQTNIDFYEVVKVYNKKVAIRKISSYLVRGEEGFMQGHVLPTPHDFVGEEMIKTVLPSTNNSCSFKIKSYAYAWPWEGKEMWCSWYA